MSSFARRFDSPMDSIDFGPSTLLLNRYGFTIHFRIQLFAGALSIISDAYIISQIHTGGDTPMWLVYKPNDGRGHNYWLFAVANETSFHSWETDADPFTLAAEGDGQFHTVEIEWAATNADSVGFNGQAFLVIDNVAHAMTQKLSMVVPRTVVSTSTHLCIGANATTGTAAWTKVAYDDVGFYYLGWEHFDDVGAKRIMTPDDHAKFLALYPSPVVESTPLPNGVGGPTYTPYLDSVSFKNVNPELGFNGILSGAVTGTTAIAGSGTLPPYGIMGSLDHPVAHVNGIVTGSISWISNRPPSSDVVFTPTCPVATANPLTVTLPATVGASVPFHLDIDSGASLGSHDVTISNSVSMAPLVFPFTVAVPAAYCDKVVIPPAGEFAVWYFLDTAGNNPTAVTNGVRNAVHLTKMISGGGTETITLDLFDGFDNANNTLWAPIVKPYDVTIDNSDGAPRIVFSSGWTEESNSSWGANGPPLFHQPNGYSTVVSGGTAHMSGNPSATALATFPDIIPGGIYELWMIALDTHIGGGLALDFPGPLHARYRIRDNGTTIVADLDCDQSGPSSSPEQFDGNKQGRRWVKIGTALTLDGTFATVELSNQSGSGYLHFDAIRLLKTGPPWAKPDDTVTCTMADLAVTTAAGQTGVRTAMPVTVLTTDDPLSDLFKQWYIFDPSAPRMRIGDNVENHNVHCTGPVLANIALICEKFGGNLDEANVLQSLNAGSGVSLYLSALGFNGNTDATAGQPTVPRDLTFFVSFTADCNTSTVLTGRVDAPTTVTRGPGSQAFTVTGAMLNEGTYAPSNLGLVITNTNTDSTVGHITDLVVHPSSVPIGWPHRTHPYYFDKRHGPEFWALRFLDPARIKGSNNVDWEDYPRDDKSLDPNISNTINAVAAIRFEPVVGADLALANQYFQPDRGHALAKVTLSAPPAKRFTPTHLALFNPCSPSSFDDTGVQASGATATCTLSGNTVGSAAVTAPGTGYVLFNSDRTKAAGDNQYFYPVSFSGGGGAGATGTVYIDGPSGGVIDLVIDNHGSGYTSPPTITIGTLGYPAAAAYNYSDNNMIIPITDTTYIVRINSGSAPVGSYASGYSDVHKTLTGTTTVTGTMFLAPGLGAGISLQERVRICNDLGRDYWHQSGILESDACLAAVGAYIAANLDAGLKCYAENANEVWNTGPPFPDTPRARILANHENYKYSISGGHDGYQIGTEAQYHALVSHNQHTILQQAFTAAGRANDFFAVIGSGLGQPGFTSDVFATLKRYNLNYTSPVFFPNPVHLAIANYDNNTTVAGAYYTPGDAPAPIGASYLRLSAKGLVDLDVLHNFHQIGWKGLVDLHISSAADSDFDVVIVGYEGGLSGMRPGFFSPGETAQDVTDMSHEAFRHSWAFHAERCRLQKRTADGWTAVCIYTYGSGDVGLDGGNWIVVTSPESPLGSGDPSEDRNPHDLRNAYSQVGGAHLAYVSDIPTPTGTLSLIGPSTGITGVPSASFAVTGTDLSGSDTVTAHCTGGSFSGSPMSFSSGTSANTFTFAPTSDGAHSITITDSLGATILNSPIIYTSSTPTPTPTVTQYVASPMRGRHRRRSI